MEIFYLGRSKTIHDLRFIETLSEMGVVEALFLEDSPSKKRIHKKITDADLVVAAPISDALDHVVQSQPKFLIGISMAYEVNVECQDPKWKAKITENLSAVDCLLVDNPFVLREIQEHLGFEGVNILIPYGINLEEYLQIPNIKKNIDSFLCLRNWTSNHGNKFVLEAFHLLQRQGVQFKLRMAGEGRARDTWASQFPELSDSPDLEFLGPLDRNSVVNELKRATYYVSGSLSDGTSISLLEAMAAGRICIVSDFEANKFLIDNDDNGFTFKNGSARDMADVIANVMQLPDNRIDEITRAARRKARLVGDWKTNSVLLRKMLGDLIEGKKTNEKVHSNNSGPRWK